MVSPQRAAWVWLLGAGVAVLTGCGGGPEESLDTSSQAIVGGQLDTEHKNVFGLAIHQGNSGATCSSSLIAPNLLLTARHCVTKTVDEPVICGKAALTETLPPQNIYATNAVQLGRGSNWFQGAEVFVPGEGDDTCGYDIALLVLTESVPRAVATAAVPRIDRDVAEGESYAAVGYGIADDGEAGDRMVRDALAVACEPGRCGFGVRVSEFVGETGVCQGDSGGPALDADGKVVGIVSRGAEDCSTPVYSTVTAWRDLIVRVAAHAAERGGYSAPFWVDSGISDPPAVLTAAKGESCSSAVSCAEGVVCHDPGTGPVCVATCSSDPECAAAESCQAVADSASKVCLAAAPKTDSTAAMRPAPKSSCSFGEPRRSSVAWLALATLALGLARRRPRHAR